MEGAHPEREERVTPLELFFDLVFVFAITQVTGLLATDTSWGGLLRGVLVLGALWWAWVAYAWLTNTLDPEETGIRLAMFGAMGAMLIVALTVPEAFGDHGVMFGVAYLLVRVLHIVLYAKAGKDDPDLLAAVLRFAPSAIVGPALIIGAGFVDGNREALWAAALAIDYLGPLLGRGRGWRVSPGHFAERHGLIVIIALGESIVALGVGAGALHVDRGVVVAAVLGIAVVATLWWAYFDFATISAEQRLREAQGVARATLARDLYSYLHLPMIVGIVLFALGLKKTLADVGESLETVTAVGLCGGLALYFLSYNGIRIRLDRKLSRGRLITAVVLAALVPVAVSVPALVALALVAALCTSLIAYEVLWWREERARIRQGRSAAAT
jgi:low temperature requirement protein LtrA